MARCAFTTFNVFMVEVARFAFDEDPEILQVVSVNIDTFSSSSKWRDIVDWANAQDIHYTR